MEVLVPEEFRFLYKEDHQPSVLKIPNPLLRKKAAELPKVTKKTQLLIDEMFRIMRGANGIGLAAPRSGSCSG